MTTNYRPEIFDRITLRAKRRAEWEAAERLKDHRRICCFCQKDLGPTGLGFIGDSHGACSPLCEEAKKWGHRA